MKTNFAACLILMAGLAIAGFADAQSNPFSGGQRHAAPSAAGDDNGVTGQNDQGANAPIDTLTAIRTFILSAQGTMNRELASLVHQVQPGDGAFNLNALLLLLGLAALYGVFHALGPGHGKSIASAWFLSRPASLRNGLQLGFLMAGVHLLIAGGLVLAIFTVLQLSLGALTKQVSWWMGIISFALLAVLALFMVIGSIVEFASGGTRHLHFHLGHKHHHHDGDHDHPHDHDHKHDEVDTGQSSAPAQIRFRELAVLAFVSMAIPCPGAVGIMVLANGAGLLLVGLMAVAALSIGMGITTSAAGTVGILVRRGIIKGGATVSGKAGRRVAGLVRIVGSLLLLLIACSLAWSQFSP